MNKKIKEAVCDSFFACKHNVSQQFTKHAELFVIAFLRVNTIIQGRFLRMQRLFVIAFLRVNTIRLS